MLAAESAAGGASIPADGLSEAHCLELMLACLERGNSTLAQSIFRGMSAAAVIAGAPVSPTGSLLTLSSMDGGDAGAGGAAPSLRWPRASVQTAASLVVGLTRVLETRAAISLINSVRARGLTTTEDVCFGHVVGCPQDGWVLGGGVVEGRSAGQALAAGKRTCGRGCCRARHALCPVASLPTRVPARLPACPPNPTAITPPRSSKPLAVVQPQEGVKIVADSFSR